ncbi:MAG TPA: kelch repeat-containing protein [Parvularculaceae bacterium]|nr:kelch repeat-containing protein [Parvularculaceae bacterium]HRX39027.1 kelch repeat-containing protein [Parvularculaceae bacterium]
MTDRRKSELHKSELLRRELLIGGAASLATLSAGRALAESAPPAPIGIWSERAPMPFPVQEIYPTRFWREPAEMTSFKPHLEGVLVNAGGLSVYEDGDFDVSDRVTIYDPISDSWGEGPRLPEARHHIALVFHNGFLFAVGGFYADDRGIWQMQTSLWRVESLSDRYWAPQTSLPIPQAESVAASVGGHIHVVGGRAPAGSLNASWGDHIDTDMHWAYDSGSDRWAPRAPLPTPRNSATGSVVNGLLYVIGGRTVSDGNTPVVEVYEPVSDRWQKCAPLPASANTGAPKGQSGLASAVWNGKIYVFGGEWQNPTTAGVYADVFEYDPRQDKWRAVASMPRPRHGLGAVALADGIYVCGGATGPSGQGTCNYLDKFEI